MNVVKMADGRWLMADVIPLRLASYIEKARHLTDGRPLSRLGKVHASMTLLSLLHRLACIASEISLMILMYGI